MLDACKYSYDAASVAEIGRRDLQEDAIAMHFPRGSDLGYIVLADGMGGHAAGDVASKIVVREFYSELRPHLDDPNHFEGNAGVILREAMDRANGEVARHAADWPEQVGMGSTLVAPILVRNRLYWISVGDSPLYLLRGNRMTRLNQEHSMARRLARMVQSGMISQSDADRDPDRDCLTSVLLGTRVSEIDCRDRPLDLIDGDVVIVASDGLLFLDEMKIAAVVYENRHRPSSQISAKLLQEIRGLDDPYQDNVAVGVIKVGNFQDMAAPLAVPGVKPDVATAPAAASLVAALTPAAGPGTTVSPRAVPKSTTIQLHVSRKGKRLFRSYTIENEG